LLTRLEILHNLKIIHRDIKPENMVIGLGKESKVIHLIDFGLSKYFANENGEHIIFQTKKGMIGTRRYASVNTHKGYSSSRRDDLESLGYVIIYFLKGHLP